MDNGNRRIGNRRIVARQEELRDFGEVGAILFLEVFSHALQELTDGWKETDVYVKRLPAGIVTSNKTEGKHF